MRCSSFANSATVHAGRLDAALAARAADALPALIGEHAEVVDQKAGETFGRERWLSGFRALFEARELEARHEPIAGLGTSLALFHRSVSASGFGGGAHEAAFCRIEEIALIETDEQGRCTRTELFAADRIGEAIARLYARYAERAPAGAGRVRAAGIARSVATVLGPSEPDRIRPVLALDVRYVDHRALGWGSARGVLAFLRGLRTVQALASRIDLDTDELLALRDDALVARRTITAVSTHDRRYRGQLVALWAFAANGRVAHWEHFDDDQRAAALARFDVLAVPPAQTRIVENAATRVALDLRTARSAHDVLATRGDRLALVALDDGRARGGAPSAPESLVVVEVDELGNPVARVRFDAGERAAAHAELDERYAAGESACHAAMWAALSETLRALSTRNWGELIRLVSPGLVAEDHRLLGWGAARSPEQYVKAVRPLTELGPDVALRMDHVLLADRAALFVASWTGSDATGAFEIPAVIVFGAGRDGRLDRAHHYSLEQIDAARARFAELGGA